MERGEASKAMFWTSLRAGFVYHLALFTFEEGYLIYLWVRSVLARRRGEVVESRVCRKGKGGEITLQSFAKKSVKNVLLCVVGVLAEAIGASIGTYVYPGYGTLALDRLSERVPICCERCLFVDFSTPCAVVLSTHPSAVLANAKILFLFRFHLVV